MLRQTYVSECGFFGFCGLGLCLGRVLAGKTGIGLPLSLSCRKRNGYICKVKNTVTNRYVRVVVMVAMMVAVMTHFPEIIALFDRSGQFFGAEGCRNADSVFPGIRFWDVANEVLFAFFSLLLLFFVNSALFGFGKDNVRLGKGKIALSFLLTWIMSSLLGKIFVLMHQQFDIPAIDSLLHHYLHPLRDGMISCVVTGTNYLFWVNRRNKQVLLENQQLKSENLINRYQGLKNQLNPHMLFNSLNTLFSLIRENPGKAQSYLQELSKVLRYTLQDTERQSVSLRDEMDFAQSYMYLLKMRYEENLTFDIRIEDSAWERLVPPMSVQMLLENAVKHNEISKRNPLSVRVISEGAYLSVSNPLQPKMTGSRGTRIGLANLSKRYQLLFQTDIEIIEENGRFCVRLPLI